MSDRGTQDLSLQGLVVPGHTNLRRAKRAITYRTGFRWVWGITFFMGELTSARERVEQWLARCRPEMHDSQIAQYGTELGVVGHCYHALTLWHLGYPDQAVEESY